MKTDEEPSIDSVLACLWSSRWFIGLTVLIVTGACVATAMLLPRQYQATVLLMPESSSSGGQLGALSSIASQFSGLASLAGVAVPNDSKKAESIAVLQSDSLTESYIAKNNLLPVLYSKKWDAARGTWRDTDPKKVPTLWKANQYFKRSIRTVSTDTKTGIVTLTINWTNPVLAAKWANDLVNLTNAYLRDQAIGVSERNIAYLNEEAAKTDEVGVKQAIYVILQSEINKAMLARGSEEFALKTLDAAQPPEVSSSPSVMLWGTVGFIGSAGFSLLLVVKRDERRRKRGFVS